MGFLNVVIKFYHWFKLYFLTPYLTLYIFPLFLDMVYDSKPADICSDIHRLDTEELVIIYFTNVNNLNIINNINAISHQTPKPRVPLTA